MCTGRQKPTRRHNLDKVCAVGLVLPNHLPARIHTDAFASHAAGMATGHRKRRVGALDARAGNLVPGDSITDGDGCETSGSKVPCAGHAGVQ